jgi:AmiR/NasT family two-component response regulator
VPPPETFLKKPSDTDSEARAVPAPSCPRPIIEGVEIKSLGVLVANEQQDRIAVLAALIAGLGHELIARDLTADNAVAAVVRDRPDIAVVATGGGHDVTLEVIDRIVDHGACPVIALLRDDDPELIHEAALRGVAAYIVGGDRVDEWRNWLEIVMRRHAELRDLRAASAARAVLERAKGILMERHAIDEAAAYGMLRDFARANNLRLADVASSIERVHRLLPPG